MSWFEKFLKKVADYRQPLRPPGAINEKDFLKHCIRCRRCVEICPYQSIKVVKTGLGKKSGTPVIIPREVPCYLCMKCPPECPTDALQPIVKKEQVRMGLAKIDQDTCLPYLGIICRACYERCPIYTEAIILKEEIYPEVVEEKCVGCGICENVCPNEEPSVVVLKRND